jgi:hypothetical protein
MQGATALFPSHFALWDQHRPQQHLRSQRFEWGGSYMHMHTCACTCVMFMCM